MTKRWRGACLAALTAICVRAQDIDSLPPYHAGTQVSGVVRIWGSAQMASLVAYWEKGFVRQQPGVRFENHLYGAVSAIAGLYTGVADLAVSREIWPMESLAFEQVCGYPPSAVEVATGSFDVPTKSDSLEIFVHRENPISELTLAQADGIFGAQHAAGRMEIRTWGEMGLRGDWASQPIHPYGYNTENAGARFFRDVVLKGSSTWNCALKEFGNATAADGSRVDAGQRIVGALARDKYGIAIANMHYASAEVKALSIASDLHGPFIAPSRESVRNRTYPLARRVYVFLNRAPNHPADLKLAEFLGYVLSRDGQRDVTLEGDYLPLPPHVAREKISQLR